MEIYNEKIGVVTTLEEAQRWKTPSTEEKIHKRYITLEPTREHLATRAKRDEAINHVYSPFKELGYLAMW